MSLHDVVDPRSVAPRVAGHGLSRRGRAAALLAAALVVVALAFGVTIAVNSTVGIQVGTSSGR